MQEKKKISQITGIRGVAAFIIAYLFHYLILFDTIPNFNNIYIEKIYIACYMFFACGSELFFVTSGYFIHKSYYSRIAEDKIGLKDYLLPKMKKVYPMMVTTVIITWILQKCGLYLWGAYPLHTAGAELRNSVLSLVISIAGVQSGYISDGDAMSVNGPSWFVSILFLCYFIYFVIIKLCKNKFVSISCFVGFIMLGMYLGEHYLQIPLLYSCNGRGYMSFFAGVCLCEIVQQVDSTKSKVLERLTYIIGATVFSIIVISFWINDNQLPHALVVFDVIVYPLLMFLLLKGYILSKFFSLKCIVRLGEMAMPIFLCNIPTNIFIRMCDIGLGLNLDYSNVWVWIMHIIISLIIVWIFHCIFEKQMLKKEKKS